MCWWAATGYSPTHAAVPFGAAGHDLRNAVFVFHANAMFIRYSRSSTTKSVGKQGHCLPAGCGRMEACA
jgi:hypothetical protein